jgi:hypothetical protein
MTEIEAAAQELSDANYAFHMHPEPGTAGWLQVKVRLEQAWRVLNGAVDDSRGEREAVLALGEVEAGGSLFSLDDVYHAEKAYR